MGSATLIGTGWWGGALLLTFFIGSTVVSRTTNDPAVARGEAKGNTRDWAQVLANGGAPAAGALLGLAVPLIGIWALTFGLAGAAADTWATSIGALSRSPPRHLLTWRAVEAGTSGAITWLGTLGGMIGALTLGVVGWAATADLHLLTRATFIGTGTMMFDSLLGATLQGRFHCGQCDLPTERTIHRCGARTVRVAGLGSLTNDGVNAVAVVTATLAGAVLGLFAGPHF